MAFLDPKNVILPIVQLLTPVVGPPLGSQEHTADPQIAVAISVQILVPILCSDFQLFLNISTAKFERQ